MDPITAFGLAAGIITIIDFSYKTLKTCKELYKDGSLAEHRVTNETAKQLCKLLQVLGRLDRLRHATDFRI